MLCVPHVRIFSAPDNQFSGRLVVDVVGQLLAYVHGLGTDYWPWGWLDRNRLLLANVAMRKQHTPQIDRLIP